MKFRSLVHTYMNHRHYLKVQAYPSPCSWEPGGRGRGEALSIQEGPLGLTPSWVPVPTLPLASCDLGLPYPHFPRLPPGVVEGILREVACEGFGLCWVHGGAFGSRV